MNVCPIALQTARNAIRNAVDRIRSASAAIERETCFIEACSTNATLYTLGLIELDEFKANTDKLKRAYCAQEVAA